jgi:hypothetical protein
MRTVLRASCWWPLLHDPTDDGGVALSILFQVVLGR